MRSTHAPAILLLVSLLFLTTQAFATFTSTYFHASTQTINISGTHTCSNEQTAPASDCTIFNKAELRSSIPSNMIKFTQITFNVYDFGSGAAIAPKDGITEFDFGVGNNIDIPYDGTHDVRGYAFDITITYTMEGSIPLSEGITTSLTFYTTLRPGQQVKSQPYTFPHYQSLLEGGHATPVLGVNDPRIFRLSMVLKLDGFENKPVTDITINAVGSWYIKPRDNVSPEDRRGCIVNSVQYLTTLTSDHILTISFIEHVEEDADEYEYAATFTPDVSIHCPDYVISQRYPPESKMKSWAGFLLIDGHFTPETAPAERVHTWGTSISAEIFNYAPNPYLIDGDLYLEPHNDFAFTKFEVLYDDRIIEQETTTTNADLVSFDTYDLPWNGQINFRFVPISNSADAFWERDHVLQFDGSPADQSHTFNYKSDVFGDNKLTSFSFVAHGKYDSSKPLPTATAIAVAGLTTTTTTSSKQVDLTIPYVSEVHHCNNPVNDQIVFKHNNNNLHIELLELALDSKKVSFSFPQNTYRFEGQFADCFMERKSKGKSWEFVTQLAGVGENGSSYGSLRSLQFALPGDLQLYSGLSYRFKCPNGVSNVRHRYFIPPTELLTVSVTPLDYDRLDDHHHHFQTTIQFTPRENTNIVLIMFIVIASISLAAVLIAVLYFCGFFGYIYRLVTPTVDYSLQNSGSKIKWVQHE